ncbi:FliG C-terminal domain-containing protein [Henriciella sp.]|uniref:flagellar motor switch protein FliG n=1 Tax=Henriciella sp. TaxID=1968823 RepID=UPI0026049E0A|nr:FliG C-terminal domain-containing protein [Henriciella sp.]
MSLPALAQQPMVEATPGTRRAARLMRSLGSAGAAVWAELSPDEADRLAQVMDSPEPDVTPARADDETSAFLSDFHRPDQGGHQKTASIWTQLDVLEPAMLARAITCEHPQLIAVILSRLSPEVAAQTVRALPRELATQALKRLMTLGRIRPDTLSLIETAMQDLVASKAGRQSGDGLESVARIFDQLDPRLEQGLMSSLDQDDPGSAARIRALMFTFDDLAALGPAAIQTILSRVDRADLAVALKGAKASVRQVFLDNMTKRAGEMLVAETSGLGPVRRSEIEKARQQVITIARTLARRGDILAQDDPEDELIE